MSYLYNYAGELVKSSTGNFSLEYDYSEAGRLRTVFSQNEELISNIKFTAEGEICSEILSGGIEGSLNYDAAAHFLKNMSVSLNDSKIFEAAYTYTAQGNPSSAAFHVLNQDPFTAEFEYDIYNRLIRSETTLGELGSGEEYSYDIGGNMTDFVRRDSSGKAIVTRNYEISDDSNRIKAVTINGARSELCYDEYGRLRKLINEKEISFDEFGRLASVGSENFPEKYTYEGSVSPDLHNVYLQQQGNAQPVKTELAVIVHGGKNIVFADFRVPTDKDPYHRALTGEEFADKLWRKIRELGINPAAINRIKLISCHGAESMPFLPSTAQVLADTTGKTVYAYRGEVSIDEVSRGLNPVPAQKFSPRSGFGGRLLTRFGV